MSLTLLAFMVLFLGCCALSFLRHPVYGVYAYLLAFYGDPASRWWGQGIPDLRWSLAASLVMLASVLLRKKRLDTQRPPWHRNGAALLLMLYTAWLWLQLPWALNFDEHLAASILFTKYVVLFYLLYDILETEQQFSEFIIANVLGAAYLGYLAWQAGSGGRLEGVGGSALNEANAMGMHLGTMVLLGGVLLLRLRNKLLWVVVFLSLPLMLNGIVQTQSRSAFLALVVGGLAAYYLKPIKLRRRFLLFAFLGIVAFMLVAQSAFWARMQTLSAAVDEQEQVDNSANSRIYIALAMWEMFKQFPLGIGHRGTEVLAPLYLDKKFLVFNSATGTYGSRASHSTPMTLLTEQGVPGAILYLCVVGWVARQVLRLKRLDRVGLPTGLGLYRSAIGGGLMLLFVAGQFVDYLKVEVMIWLLVSLVLLPQYASVTIRAAVAERPRRRSVIGSPATTLGDGGVDSNRSSPSMR